MRFEFLIPIASLLATTACSRIAKFSGITDSNGPDNHAIVQQTESAITGRPLDRPQVAPAKAPDFALNLRFDDTSEPLKLVLIVDDSSSMVPKQQLLAKALDSAMESVRGKNVTVYLYSSSIFNRTFKFFGTNYLNNYVLKHLPLGNTFATWPGLHYSEILSDTLKPSLAFIPTVRKGGIWITATSNELDFVPEEAMTKFVINQSGFTSQDGTLKFTDNMSAQDFAAVRSKLKQEIILGDRGNPEEMPLCAMAAMLDNDGPNKIFASKDRVAFLIISDEDQTSRLLPCPYANKQTVLAYQNTNAIARSLQTVVTMNYQAKCDSTVNDGYCDRQPSLQRLQKRCKINSLCDPSKPMNSHEACTTEQRADYLQYFRQTYAAEIQSGKYRLSDNDTCNTVLQWSHQVGSSVPVEWNNINPAPFIYQGKTYPSVVDYFKEVYPDDIFSGEVWFSTWYGQQKGGFINYDGVTNAGDLPALLRTRAVNLFGPGNFTVSVIGNTGAGNASGCAVDPSAESKILFSAADSRSSVCEADYSKGLAWLQGFASKKLFRSYQVPAKYVASEYQLLIAADGKESVLGPDQYTYDVSMEMLTLTVNVPYVHDAKIIARAK
ncbi:MAG: hypothetical protein RIQ81_2473 [Pseudomonadota bacterium]|jgi:hypothetical protein